MITALRTFTDNGIPILLAIFLLLGGCIPEPRSVQELFDSDGVRFSERDRETILQFYSTYEFPPELSDPELLSPDPEKRIETAAVLPPDPGGTPLPADLESQLSSLPPGYIRFRVGEDVILMDSRTREVLDVIPGVLP